MTEYQRTSLHGLLAVLTFQPITGQKEGEGKDVAAIVSIGINFILHYFDLQFNCIVYVSFNHCLSNQIQN